MSTSNDPFDNRDAYEEHVEKMDRILKSKTGLVMPRFGFTPQNVAGGILWIILIPVWIIVFVFADLVNGWRWWRVLGVLLGVVIVGLAMAGGIYAEIADPTLLDRIGERMGTNREDTIVNIGAGGVVCSLIFCFPRTTVAVAVLALLEQAYRYFF